MSLFLDTLKKYNLTQLYIALPIEEKRTWEKYMPKSCDCGDCNEGNKFSVSSPARFLWVTAANIIPHKKYKLAETLLKTGLQHAHNEEDLLWIHVNMAQLYYDQLQSLPGAQEKCLYHCNAIVKTGFLSKWVKNVMKEIT